MDSQQIEIIGRNILIAQLIAADLEVAVPLRDKGVDLIVYSDVDETNRFQAVPLQLKVARNASFSIDRKYESVAGLIMVYVWNVAPDDGISKPRIFAMRYEDAIKIASELRYTETSSWKNDGSYFSSAPSDRLKTALDTHEMAVQKWLPLLEIGKRST